MPDFRELLKKPAGEAKRPPVLPAADYPGIVKSFEVDDKNKNRTPYVRLWLGLTEWPASVPDTWDVHDVASGKSYTVAKTDVDLSKRQMRRDFFLTEDALDRLDEMIRSCGINASGRAYEEILPELVGQHVLVEVQQYMNQNTNEIGNQLGAVKGAQ